MHDPKKFHLSNSKMRDWEEMCAVEWKAKYIDQNPAYQQATDAMERGNVFETEVIGVSVGGKVTVPSKKLKDSVYYERIKLQAAEAKRWLKLFGGKILGRQEYLYGVVYDLEGQEIPICGNLDIRYGWPEEPGRNAVIDLKFTGNTESTFGKFAWGRPNDMDMSQAIHYTLLHRITWPDLPDPEFYYWVFDHEAAMKKLPIRVRISEPTILEHIERLSRAYFEITDSMMFDTWTPKNDYSNCSKCKVKCSFERKIPEIIEIEK